MSRDAVSLTAGHRPRNSYSEERVPILIAPEVRDRLNNLLTSDAFMGTGVGFSAFIDRACEAAETEYAQCRWSVSVQWCPVCRTYHAEVGEKTDAGAVTRPCPLIPTCDPRYYGSEFYTGPRG